MHLITFYSRVILLNIENGRGSRGTDGFQWRRRFVYDDINFGNAGTTNIGAGSSLLYTG